MFQNLHRPSMHHLRTNWWLTNQAVIDMAWLITAQDFAAHNPLIDARGLRQEAARGPLARVNAGQ